MRIHAHIWCSDKNNAHTTFVAKVIDHDNLSQVFPRGSFDDTVHRPHQGGPTLIMEDDDHAGCEEVLIIVPVFAPEENTLGYKEHTLLENLDNEQHDSLWQDNGLYTQLISRVLDAHINLHPVEAISDTGNSNSA